MASVKSYKKETHTKIWDMVWMALGKVHGEEHFVFYLYCLPIVSFMIVNPLNSINIIVSINSIQLNYKH